MGGGAGGAASGGGSVLGGAAKGAAAGSVVPGIGTAIGAGVGALGSYLGNKGQRKAEQSQYEQQRADIGVAQGRLDQSEQEFKDYQGTIPVEQLLGMAGQPSTTSSQSVSNINQLVSAETAGEDKALTGMLRSQFEKSLGQPALHPGYLEGIAQGGARQIRDLQGGLANRAALTGGQSAQQSGLDALLAGSNITAGVKSQIAQAPMLADQIMAQRRGAAQGFVDPRLGRRTKGRTTTRSSGTSYSPGQNISNILGIYGTQAPRKPDIILPT